jgi:hypothetical protein
MSDGIKKEGFDLTDIVRKAMDHKHAAPDPRTNGHAVIAQPPPDSNKTLLHTLDLPWPGPDDRLVQHDMIPSVFAAMYAIISPSPIHGGKPKVILRIAFLGDPDQPQRAHQYMIVQAGQVIASSKGMPSPKHLQTIGNPLSGQPVSLFEVPIGLTINPNALDPNNSDDHIIDDDNDDDEPSSPGDMQ